MEERKPWDLKYVLIGYNFALVVLSMYMVYEVSTGIKSFNTSYLYII